MEKIYTKLLPEFLNCKGLKMLNKNVEKHVKLLIQRYPELEYCQESIVQAYSILEKCFENGGKVLIAGNGGSSADAEHIVGELMKSFVLKRPILGELAQKISKENPELGQFISKNLQGALPAIALDGHFALTTAYMNDNEPLLCFAQQVNGYGTEKDVFWGISTSGNSKNILYAATVARAKGMPVIGMTGQAESQLSDIADACICVPRKETYQIQELHLPVYHCLCLMLEERFFS